MSQRSEQGEQFRTDRRPYGVVPPGPELDRMRKQGMSQQEIAEEISRRSGYPVTRGAIATALRRAGLSGPSVKKYPELVPWRIANRHEGNYNLQMLRLEARRRLDPENLSEGQTQRLDSWKRKMESGALVVFYDYESEDGFYLLDREPSDTDLIRQPKPEA